MENFKKEIAGLLSPHLEMSEEEIFKNLELPKRLDQGDLAFPCFRLAATMKKSPALIADELAGKIASEKYEARNIGPYLNFFIDRKILAETVINDILDKKVTYGSSDEGENKPVIIEYSSANISKELHFGHIRGIMIGSSLYKITNFLGYKGIAINHLGDYGINFGKIITAFMHWGNKEHIEEVGVRGLLELYVKFNKASETDPKYMEEARHWFYKLEEEKDPEALELWKWFKDVSLKEYNRVYKIIGCHFDSFDGEAFYSDMMPAVRQELLDKNLIVVDEGAEIIDLSDENLPNIIVTTSQGTSLYITRDIAAAIYRKNHYDFYRNCYIVGSEQRLHFNQLKAILKKMGYDWYQQCEHIDHGLVMMEGGKISSRDGDNIFLEDVINTAIERTRNIIEEKNPGLENKDEIARQVGLGALAYRELSNNRVKDYSFNWDEAISFEGETGPYLQYTNVRCHSLLEKGAYEEGAFDGSYLREESSKELVWELGLFPSSIRAAFEKMEPALLSRYLMGLAKLFNKFYSQVTILTEDKEERAAKLALVRAVSLTLETGMGLINMEAPKKM
ncbi:MAG: arginine--tRNA ligase [Tissierellia bacterium]|nr:arginine--tRNA ligase [Tissierellia bacterium]